MRRVVHGAHQLMQAHTVKLLSVGIATAPVKDDSDLHAALLRFRPETLHASLFEGLDRLRVNPCRAAIATYTPCDPQIFHSLVTMDLQSMPSSNECENVIAFHIY